MDEAAVVGDYLKMSGIRSVIVVTSKYHTRRARLAFKSLLPSGVTLKVVGTRFDSYRPWKWWMDADTRSHVLHEYGGLVYYWIKLFFIDKTSYFTAMETLPVALFCLA